jgi:hypothetical protein
MRLDQTPKSQMLRNIERANLFAAACKRAVSQGKPSAAQIFASAAASQRRAALAKLGAAR